MGIYFSFSFGVLTLSCWRSLGKRVVYSIGPAGLGGQTSADSPGTTGKTGNSVVYAAWDILLSVGFDRESDYSAG